MEENNRYPNNGGNNPTGRYGYPNNGNDYPNDRNGYQNGGQGYRNGGNGYQNGGNGYPNRGNGYQNGGNGYPNRGNGYPNGGNGYQNRGNGYPNGGNGYQNRGNGYSNGRNGYPNGGYGYQNRNGGYNRRNGYPGYDNGYYGRQNGYPAAQRRNEHIYVTVKQKRRIGPVIAVFVLLFAIAGGIFAWWYFHQDRRTDEQKIRDCLQEFAAAYSVGDMKRVAECCDKNTRSAINGISGFSIGGFGVSSVLQSLFSISSASAGEDSVQMEVKNIKFNSDHTRATVDVTQTIVTSFLGAKEKQAYDDVVIMVKENNDWKILGSG